MKILLINWMDMANPMAGGAEVHLTEIFERFAARGDDVTLVVSGFSGAGREDERRGVRIIRTGTRETFNFVAPSLLRRLDRENNFDLIVEDINKIPFYTPLYLRKPLLVMIPHLFGNAIYRETNFVLATYVYCMEKPIPLIYRNAFFEVISASTAHDVIRRGISPKRVRVVHCGMDHDTYSFDLSVRKSEQPTILYVGRLKRYKSVDVIIRALPEVVGRVPDVRLVVAGSGDAMGELKRLALSLNLDRRVVFTGYVSGADKVDWMRRSHVIVNPSPREGWGLTNIEANACGTPAVASDVDGLRDSVRDGVTGLLFPYGDHRSLAERLIRMLTDDALRKTMAVNALAWAETFSWDAAARETMEIIEGMFGH